MSRIDGQMDVWVNGQITKEKYKLFISVRYNYCVSLEGKILNSKYTNDHIIDVTKYLKSISEVT